MSKYPAPLIGIDVIADRLDADHQAIINALKEATIDPLFKRDLALMALVKNAITQITYGCYFGDDLDLIALRYDQLLNGADFIAKDDIKSYHAWLGSVDRISRDIRRQRSELRDRVGVDHE